MCMKFAPFRKGSNLEDNTPLTDVKQYDYKILFSNNIEHIYMLYLHPYNEPIFHQV